MLRGALLGSHLAMVATAIACGALGGTVAAANALVASALVVAFFASGQAVQMLAGELANSSAMALVMLSYLARVTLLGLALAFAMTHQDRLEQVFDRGAFMAGATSALMGWLAGIFVANARQHVFVYDRDFDKTTSNGGSM